MMRVVASTWSSMCICCLLVILVLAMSYRVLLDEGCEMTWRRRPPGLLVTVAWCGKTDKKYEMRSYEGMPRMQVSTIE
jgi:hypothetical protein